MIDGQFYPTPRKLASSMWSAFNSKIDHHSIVLEPEAGRGDLLNFYDVRQGLNSSPTVDVIEIDFDNQAILREKGFNIVGHDFLQCITRKRYTHIIMNPPFNQGAEHVLHAINLLNNGELVALVNAETIDNPCTESRKQLARKIEDLGGSVKYAEDEFLNPDTQRKTRVRVAIIHIEIRSDRSLNYTDGLRKAAEVNIDVEEKQKTDLALPDSTIENAVLTYSAAVESLEEYCQAVCKYGSKMEYHSGLLADSIIRTEEEIARSRTHANKYTAEAMRGAFNARLEELNEKAWSHILQATKAGKQLSSGVQDKLRADFKEVSKLEFSVANIHGFLRGLVLQRGEMNIDMMIEIFDQITRYHTDNRHYYRGWKSNDKHALAYRIGTTRFILPGGFSSWSATLDWKRAQELYDFDLAFAILDGSGPEETSGILPLLQNESTRESLFAGERLESDYFEIRAYRQANTIHFFPKDKKLVDRLNLIVGRKRQWIPPEAASVNKSFWRQYQLAEKITRQIRNQPGFNKKRWYNQNTYFESEEGFDNHAFIIDGMGMEFDNAIDVDQCGSAPELEPPA